MHSHEDTGAGANEAELAFLQRAVELARDNVDAGQLPFGAVIMHDGTVVGTGVNTALRDRDATAHAEVAAVRDACRNLGTLQLEGATLLTSCEPCAMCHATATVAGITRILYAAPKEDVPQLEVSPPPDAVAILSRMRDALRGAAPDQVAYVPTPGSREPFRRYAARRDAAR